MENRFKKTAINTAILLALAGAPAAHAAVGDAVGSAFTVNTSSGTVAYPQVAMGAGGGFVVTWGTGSTRIARCYAADGTALSDEVTLASGVAGFHTAVAADAAGNSVVLWQDNDYAVQAQRLDSSCAPQGGVIDIGVADGGSGSPGGHEFVAAMAADGRFVVVWYEGPTTYAQRYDAAGSALGSVITVNSGSLGYPRVASRADGGFVVSWNRDYVALRYYDADGNALTGLITYNPPGFEYAKDVAVDGDGDVVPIWLSYSDYQVYARRYDASGNPGGGDLAASDDPAAAYSAHYYKGEPAVAVDDDGDFLVVWYNYINAAGIGAQRFDSADNKGGEVVVNASGIDPDVAMDADGDAVIVWDAGGSIMAQRYEGKSETVDLSVSGVADTATINVGNDITYTWTVTNNGSGTVLGVSLDDALPAGLAYSSFSDGLGDGWDCSDSSGTVTCTLPRLVSGGSSSVDLVLDSSALSGSSLDNSATGATPMSDTDSSNDSDTVTLAINNAPAFDSTPVVSGTVAVGNTLSVSTPSATDPEGDSFSVSYQWQLNGFDIVGATSDSYTISSANPHDSFSVTLRLTDSNGAFSDTTVSAGSIANNPITMDGTFSISGTALVGNNLSLSVSGFSITDADGDSAIMSYQWHSDGTDISGATSDNYTLTSSEAHSDITVTITASDGYGSSDSATTGALSIDNSDISFDTTPGISGTAAVGNTLTIIDTATSDADADTPNLSYQWHSDGTDISGATSSSYTLTSDEAHSDITVTVTLSDGYGSSDSATTVALSILNSAPSFDATPGISGTPDVGNTLTVVDTAATDVDGDSFAVSYQWQADGVDIAGATTDSYTVTSDDIHAGITVKVTADDGTDSTTESSSAVTVTNRLPSFDATPSIDGTARVGNTLSVIDTATSDEDGDTVSLSYQWQSDGVDISGATSSSYTLTSDEAHADITVAVTADDGYDTVTETTAAVSVGNTAPNFDATPAIDGTALVGNTLSVIDTATTDVDADSVSVSYQWQSDGVDISGATSSSYTLTDSEAHSDITVVVSANDGTDTSDITSSGITVGNTAPVISSVGIDGTFATGKTVSAVVSGTDADSDSLGYSYKWYVDGVLSGSNESYSIASGDIGKAIFVIVTVSDGNGGSDSDASAAQIIANSAPVFDTTPTITGTAVVGNTLDVSGVSAGDVDGDSIGYSYQWYANGVAISGAASDSYTLTSGEAHTAITVKVSASDSGGGSAVVTSNSVTVQNNTPEFSATPAISGGSDVGDTLTVSGLSITDADNDAIGYSYMWLVGGTLSGSDNSYTITTDDAGKSVTALIIASDGYGGLVTATTDVLTVSGSETNGSSSSSGGGGAFGWLGLLFGLLGLSRRKRVTVAG